MADETTQANTHLTDLKGNIATHATAPTQDPAPVEGDMYYDTTHGAIMRYSGTAWVPAPVVTSTSTSTSTTTSTSTSTTA